MKGFCIMRHGLALLVFALAAPLIGQTKVGGKLAPSGAELHCDLPEDLHRQNTSSRGSGCCVFTSIHHAALWANIPALYEFPKWLQAKGLSGGGYPGNVRERITAICKERGVPEPDYIQVENDDLEILKAACKAGRMPCVTYSYSPSGTGRYGGARISHMINIVHADDQYIATLDNNYIGVKNYEWLPPNVFKATYAPGGRGWCVILLGHGPPPPPRN